MTGFRSDIERLAKHADEFGDHAARAERLARTLQQDLESSGECWGSDEIGQSFAVAHQPRAQQALQQVAALSGLLRDTGAKFAETAAAQRRVDTSNADLLAAEQR